MLHALPKNIMGKRAQASVKFDDFGSIFFAISEPCRQMPPKISRSPKNIADECAQVSIKLDDFGLTVFFAMGEQCRQTLPKNNMPRCHRSRSARKSIKQNRAENLQKIM